MAVEIVRDNKAIEEKVGWFAKRITVRLILEMDKAGLNYGPLVAAMETFPQGIKEELNMFVMHIEGEFSAQESEVEE